MPADVLLVSLASTHGWRVADAALTAALERAGQGRVGDAPAVGRGEGDEQDVDGHLPSSCPAS